MTLVKTVELRILASAGDAQAQLDDIAAKADRLDGDAIRMRFRLDDAEGKAQLDEIKAKADRLGFKDISIKVRVDGAGRAIADLMAVKKAADDAGGPNKLQSLLGRLFGVGGSGGGGAAGGGSIPLGGVSPLMVGGIAAAVPAVEALLVEVTGLASGFAAAGAGAGAFYLLAHPAISNLTQDTQNLLAANDKLQQAQNLEAVAPSKVHAKAVQTAQDNLKAVQMSMGQDAGGAAQGIVRLRTEYDKLTTAFQPDVFKVFNAGLKLAGNLLPTVTPFARTFADAMSGLLGKLNSALFTKQVTDVSRAVHGITGAISSIAPSAGFQKFLDQFHALEGPAVTAIGEGIGKVAVSIGKLMTTMSGKDVAQTIGIAFNAVAGAISLLAGAVHNLMGEWDAMSSAAKHTATDVVGAFKAMASGIEGSWATAISFIQKIPGEIKGVFAGAASWLVGAGKAIMQGLLNGIESMGSAVVGAAQRIGSSIWGAVGRFFHFGSPSRLMFQGGQWIVQGMIGGIYSSMPALAAMAKKAAATILAEVKAEAAYAKSVAASAMTGLSLTSINLTTDTVTSGMQSYLATLKSFTADIKALSAQHLNKSVLQQLIAAGPATGDTYAQSILSGGSTGQVNALYQQITKQSAQLGAAAAMAVYGNKVTPGAGGNFTVTVNVTAPAAGSKTGQALGQQQGQALALEIIKLLKEYKRHGGNVPLGIA